MIDKQKTLERLEAEQRGRALGLVGEAAAVVGEWLQWLWTTPGVMEAMQSPPTAEVTAVTAPTNTRAAYETTYSRMTTPKSDEREPRPWAPEMDGLLVVTAGPSNASPGGVVEEAVYAIDAGEVLLADMDGRIVATSPLELDDDPAVVARSLLHAKVGKRPKPLVFPNMGYA